VESGEFASGITTKTVLLRLRHSPLSTINSPLSTNILPFQGDLVGGNFDPTRWIGLVYVVLSGRRRKKIPLIYDIIYILNSYSLFNPS
jgi:hypothetical protein